MKYRKRPLVIEARQLGTHAGENEAIRQWCGGRWLTEERRRSAGEQARAGDAPHGAIMKIPTREGPHYASPRDWIIRGVMGEFYPCKPDVFEATYEPA